MLPNPELKRLQSMVVVEVAKEVLRAMEPSKLGSREQSMLSQCQRLLDLIAEMRIDEPLLLIKLWRLHP